MIVYSETENLSFMLLLFCRADPRPLKDSYILPFCRALGAIWGEINSSRKLAIFLQLDRMRQTISIFPRHYLQHLPHHHHHLKHCRVVSWWPVWENKLLRFHYSGICALGLDGIVGWWPDLPKNLVTFSWHTDRKLFCQVGNYFGRSGHHPTIPSSPSARSARIPE